MRKITQDAARAFKQGKNFSRDNTLVLCEVDWNNKPVKQLFLHGHLIAEESNKRLRISLCGWPTMTTRERLNGLLETLNIQKGLYQSKHEQYIYDRCTQTSEPFPANESKHVA